MTLHEWLAAAYGAAEEEDGAGEFGVDDGGGALVDVVDVADVEDGAADDEDEVSGTVDVVVADDADDTRDRDDEDGADRAGATNGRVPPCDVVWDR